MTPEEQLLDYRRTVAAMYRAAREAQPEPDIRCEQFRRKRDDLFCTHPQSALSDAQKIGFTGLDYFPYDPAYRLEATLEPIAEPNIITLELQDDGPVRLRRFGQIHLQIADQAVALSVYWIMGYGGGIFLPFGDLTNKHETYGGGCSLLG